MAHSPDPSNADDIRQRLDALERENARLRRRVNEVVGSDNPNFNLVEFQKAQTRYSLLYFVPLMLLMPVVVIGSATGRISIPSPKIGPVRIIDLAGTNGGIPGIGLGVIAFGGLAVGVIAMGGGAIGIVAIGGGAFGIFAYGGGAVGVVAIGGGAFGRYVLAGDGGGKYAFTRRRQDKEAVEFFIRYFPAFRNAITTPMPVIPVDSPDQT